MFDEFDKMMVECGKNLERFVCLLGFCKEGVLVWYGKGFEFQW